MAETRTLEELLERKRELLANAIRNPELGKRLRELRAWQAARLARTYADLRAQPRYRLAVEFFLSDIYADDNFTQRDRELARGASHLRRALPKALVDILRQALELDVLTEEFDQAMAAQFSAAPTGSSYALAYRSLGRRADRQRQIDLIGAIGGALDAVVRRRWLGLALRAARAPAHLAGLGVLHDFLERGWAAFRALPQDNHLLSDIRTRETALMDALFEGKTNPFAAAPPVRAAGTTLGAA
ncbi:MAG TPA: hypothetical protein VLW26_00580 [Steroidobacteraceae bacterium]|nr:hypothetical protein [Steroidobacteraceae bacterium]